MAVKTPFAPNDFAEILSHYSLGAYVHSEAIQQGTVQTNYYIQTTERKIVFRCYENRSKESALFECHLLAYLTEHHYPCPAPFRNSRDSYVGVIKNKPYALFEFLEGQHIEDPSDHHKEQLIQKAAELQKLTEDYTPQYSSYRWNYAPDLCKMLAQAKAAQIGTKSAHDKFAWLADELMGLDLPPMLPKGICHCDFHFSNVLFQNGEFAALLDFDDANYTFLQFDVVGLMESWAWPYSAEMLDLTSARRVVQQYMNYRPLSQIEQYHLYDVYKLSILFDCVWYFNRGSTGDFYEKRKIEFLNSLGRRKFVDHLFHRA